MSFLKSNLKDQLKKNGQYHARDFNCPWRDAARDPRLVRDFLSFSNKKTNFASSDMYLNICGKSLTCVFIFCLKEN